jgi:hypothetical protein
VFSKLRWKSVNRRVGRSGLVASTDMFVVLLFEINTQHVKLPIMLFHWYRAIVRRCLGRGTFDEEDLQIAVNAGDSRDSSCKQSPSPSTIPRLTGFGVVSFPTEKNVENILLRLPRAVGDVGVGAIIAFISLFNYAPVSANKRNFISSIGDRASWLKLHCSRIQSWFSTVLLKVAEGVGIACSGVDGWMYF